MISLFDFTSHSKLCWRWNPPTCALRMLYVNKSAPQSHCQQWNCLLSMAAAIQWRRTHSIDHTWSTASQTDHTDHFYQHWPHWPLITVDTVFFLPPDQLLAKLTAWTPPSPQQGPPRRGRARTATIFLILNLNLIDGQWQWHLHTESTKTLLLGHWGLLWRQKTL